ncbi:MAG: hypothetical protein QOD07_2135 [Frankiaceae bacterium]|nr:hypothetical protein [Frankiaceae bacterium]
MTPSPGLGRLVAVAATATAAMCATATARAAPPTPAAVPVPASVPSSYLCAEPTTVSFDPYSVTTPEVCIPWI